MIQIAPRRIGVECPQSYGPPAMYSQRWLLNGEGIVLGGLSLRFLVLFRRAARERRKQRLKMTAQGKTKRARSTDVGAVGSGLQGNRKHYGVVALIGAIQAPSVETPATSDRSDS